jgi:hypothetical protein
VNGLTRQEWLKLKDAPKREPSPDTKNTYVPLALRMTKEQRLGKPTSSDTDAQKPQSDQGVADL